MKTLMAIALCFGVTSVLACSSSDSTSDGNGGSATGGSSNGGSNNGGSATGGSSNGGSNNGGSATGGSGGSMGQDCTALKDCCDNGSFPDEGTKASCNDTVNQGVEEACAGVLEGYSANGWCNAEQQGCTALQDCCDNGTFPTPDIKTSCESTVAQNVNEACQGVLEGYQASGWCQ